MIAARRNCRAVTGAAKHIVTGLFYFTYQGVRRSCESYGIGFRSSLRRISVWITSMVRVASTEMSISCFR